MFLWIVIFFKRCRDSFHTFFFFRKETKDSDFVFPQTLSTKESQEQTQLHQDEWQINCRPKIKGPIFPLFLFVCTSLDLRCHWVSCYLFKYRKDMVGFYARVREVVIAKWRRSSESFQAERNIVRTTTVYTYDTRSLKKPSESWTLTITKDCFVKIWGHLKFLSFSSLSQKWSQFLDGERNFGTASVPVHRGSSSKAASKYP